MGMVVAVALAMVVLEVLVGKQAAVLVEIRAELVDPVRVLVELL